MKFNDVQTLESLLKKLNEYGNTSGSPSYSAGGTSSTKSSPTTSQSSTSVTKQSTSPTANGTKPPEPKLVKVTAKDLDDGSEFKDNKGNVQGKVVSKVGMLPKPDRVVVQTTDNEYHLYDPKMEVMVDEHIGHDILDKMTIKKSHKKNSLKRRIKKLTRKRLGEAPLCEINFNRKEIVTDALDSPVRCGFEAETSWDGISGSSGEDVNDMGWDEVSDSVYVSSSDNDYIMEGFSEYVRENLVPDYYDDVMARYMENERDEDSSYTRFMEEGSDAPTIDAVEEYRDNFKHEDPNEYENREEDGWEKINWIREYIDEEYEDQYLDFIREYLDDDGEVYQEAYEEAERETSIDEWIGNEFYSMSNFLDDYGIDYSELNGEGGLHEIADLLSEWQKQNSKFSQYPEVGDYDNTSGDAENWAVETDSSIDSSGQGAEIISPVYETPREMLEELKSFCEWLEEKGADTNSSTGLHVTMSWYGENPKFTQDEDDEFWGSKGGPNKLKMASLLGDTYLLQTFGRENNSYTKQQSKNIKRKANDARKFSGKGTEGFSDIERELAKGIDGGKFNSINFKGQIDSKTKTNLIEFRIGGGDDYHLDMPKIVKAVIRYATVMKAGYTDAFNKDYASAIHRIVHGAGKISRADMNIGSDVNEPLLDLFKSMISKDNYFNGVTAITNAYLSLYQVGINEEEPEPDTNASQQEAQKQYVKGMGLLALDVGLDRHRTNINAKSIGVIRRSFKEFDISEDQFTDLIFSRINQYPIPTQNDRIDQKASVLKKGIDSLFKKDMLSMPKFLNIPKAERIVKGTWNAIHSDGWSKEDQEELIDKLINLTTPDVADETKRNNIKYSIINMIEDEEFNSFYSNMTRGGYNSSNPPAQPGEIYYENEFKDLMKFLNKYNNYSQPVAPHFNSNISSSDTYLENYLNSYTMKLRKRFLHLEEIKDDNFQLYVESVKKIGELSRTLLNAWGDHEQIEFDGVHNRLVFTVYVKEKLIEIFKDIKSNEMSNPNSGSVLNRLGDRMTDGIRDALGRYYKDIEGGDPDNLKIIGQTGDVKTAVKQKFKALKDWMQGFDKIAQEVGFESQADEIAGKNNIPGREDDFARSVQERPPITLNIPAHSQAYMWTDLYRDLTNPDFTKQVRKSKQLRARSQFTTKLNSGKVFVIPSAHFSQALDAYEIQKYEENHRPWRVKAAQKVMKEFYKTYGKAFKDLVDNPADYVSINGLKAELKKEGIAISTEGDSREPNVEPLVPHSETSQPGVGTPLSTTAAAAWHVNNPELSKKADALDKNADQHRNNTISTPPEKEVNSDYDKARAEHPGFDRMMQRGMQNYLARGEVNYLVGFLNDPLKDNVFKSHVLNTIANRGDMENGPFATFQDALAVTRRQGHESVFTKFNKLSLQEQIAKLENVDANRISQLHGKFVEGNLNRTELSKDQSRFDAFVNKINAGIPFQMTDKAGGGEIVLHPDMIKGVTVASDLPDPIDIDGNNVAWNKLEKTAEFGSRTGGEKVSNKGEVAEGILGCATFARLLKRPIAPITDGDIKSVMKRLPTDAPDKGGWHELTLTARETDNPIADFFTLTLNLKSDTYKDFINPEKWSLMNNISNNVVGYVNDNMDKYTKLFAKNGKVDAVKVIADGVSGETDTKVDVFLTHSLDGGPERTLQHYDMSVKVGSTKQMGQVGGGKTAQGVSTERFFILKEMFEKFGADLSVIENQFMSSATINDAYVIAYSEAAKQINTHLTTEDKEVDWLMQFLNTIKFFATLNDDRVKLVQFEDTLKGGYYVLDFKKLDRMMDKDKVDLEAVFIDDKAQPKITIINTVNNKPFLSIRKKQAQNDGYIRNYIEKEKGLVELIKVRGSGMRKKVESVQERASYGVSLANKEKIPAMIKLVGKLFRKKLPTVEVQNKLRQEFNIQAFEARHVISMWKELNSVKEGAVPNNDTIRKLKEIFAKPLMSDDIKSQMDAYICIPDPAMIRDFRAARAQYGDNFDMRSIVRGYAKVKLHKTLQKQLSK